MKTVEAAVIGVGWVGGTRAETLSRTALVDKLHLCEIRPDRLAEVKTLYKPATATLDYNDIIKNNNISVVYISTTPESNHYPICRDCLKSGKNVMLEKPIALELWEADELIQLAKRNNLKFTIGYSQRFNPKFAYAKKKIVDGTLGKVVSVLVSRHLSRSLGKKSPAACGCRRSSWSRPTISISCSGCWSRPSRSASIRRAPTATCSRSTVRTT